MAEQSELDYGKYRQEVLKKAKFLPRFVRGIPSWWALAADTLAIAGLLLAPWTLKAQGAVLIAMVMTSGIACLAILAALWNYWKAQRAQRYAFAIGSLHTAIHILRDRMSGQRSNNEIVRCLQEVLGAFAVAFSLITGTPCRACIKVIKFRHAEGKEPEQVPENERIRCSYTVTLCRDFATQELIGHLKEDPTDAPIMYNTAFSFLFSDAKRRCFFGNNLPRAKNYQNTSVTKYGAGEEGGQWSLPYRATIVWPIRRVSSHPGSTGRLFTGSQEILGYLAVDSPVTNVFNKELDFEVGALMADTLFIFLDTLYPAA